MLCVLRRNLERGGKWSYAVVHGEPRTDYRGHRASRFDAYDEQEEALVRSLSLRDEALSQFSLLLDSCAWEVFEPIPELWLTLNCRFEEKISLDVR